jgi:hypothetical protein
MQEAEAGGGWTDDKRGDAVSVRPSLISWNAGSREVDDVLSCLPACPPTCLPLGLHTVPHLDGAGIGAAEPQSRRAQSRAHFFRFF